MAKLDHVTLPVVGDMLSEYQVLVEISGVKYTCGKSDIFDVCVDMIFPLVYLGD